MQTLETISLPYPLEEFTSIIDVRSPLEFAEDHLPGAVNLPVLSNSERKEVGTLYKKDAFAARILGARYISLNAAAHLESLERVWDRNHQPLIYCWRGGLRSQSFAHIIRSVGWRARLVEGGYKAYRSYVISELETLMSQPGLQLRALTGLTGVGKTRLLHGLRSKGAQVLDLEGLANHRGSLLGTVGPQPAQKFFESQLLHTLSQFDLGRPIFVEAESNRIGRISLPASFWLKLGSARLTEVQLPLLERVELLKEDYPAFLNHPESLTELLDCLRPLRGHRLVDEWNQLALSGQWNDFLESVLRDHYDLCYRPAGSPDSRYTTPEATLDIAEFSAGAFDEACDQLLQQDHALA